MADTSKKSNLSLISRNSRTRHSEAWEINKPEPGETFLYQSQNGKMVVTQLRQGKDSKFVAEKAIPLDSCIDFDCPTLRYPYALFEGGKVMVSCSAAGESKCFAHVIGDFNQFSDLESDVGDGTEEGNDVQTQGS